MFKNHALQLSMVKADKDGSQNEAIVMPTIDPEQFSTIVKDHVKHTAIAIVAVTASVFALKTASQVVINYAPKN